MHLKTLWFSKYIRKRYSEVISSNSDISCSGFSVTAKLVNSDLNMKCSSGMPAEVSIAQIRR